MPQLPPIAQTLRNAYEDHDRTEFDAALARVVAMEEQLSHRCARRDCLCTSMEDRGQCLNWRKKP